MTMPAATAPESAQQTTTTPAATEPGAVDRDDAATEQTPAASPKRTPVERRAAAAKRLEESRAARSVARADEEGKQESKPEPAKTDPKQPAEHAADEPDPMVKIRERMAAQRAERERDARARQLEQERDEANQRAEKAQREAQARRRELTAEELRDAKRRREAGIDDRQLLDTLTHSVLHPDEAARAEELARIERENKAALEERDRKLAALEQQLQAENERRFWEAENTAFLNSIKTLEDASGLPDELLFDVGVDAIRRLAQNQIPYDRQSVVELAAARLKQLRKLFAAAPAPKPGKQPNSSPKPEADKTRNGSAPDASPRTLTADLETQSSGAPRKKPYAERKRDLIARMDRERYERQIRGEK